MVKERKQAQVLVVSVGNDGEEWWEGIQTQQEGHINSWALPTRAGLLQTSLIPSEEKFREELKFREVAKCMKC